MAYSYKETENLTREEYVKRIRKFINTYVHVVGLDEQSKSKTQEVARYGLKYVAELDKELLKKWYNYLISVKRKEEDTDFMSFGLKTEIQVQSIYYYLYKNKKKHNDFENAYFSRKCKVELVNLFRSEFTGYYTNGKNITDRSLYKYFTNMIIQNGKYIFDISEYEEREYICIYFDDYSSGVLELIIDVPNDVSSYLDEEYDNKIYIDFNKGNVSKQWDDQMKEIRIAIGKLRSRFAQKRNADSELVEYYKENRGNEKDSGWYERYERKLYIEPPEEYKLIFEDEPDVDNMEALNRYRRFAMYILWVNKGVISKKK